MPKAQPTIIINNDNKNQLPNVILLKNSQEHKQHNNFDNHYQHYHNHQHNNQHSQNTNKQGLPKDQCNGDQHEQQQHDDDFHRKTKNNNVTFNTNYNYSSSSLYPNSINGAAQEEVHVCMILFSFHFTIS